MCQQYSANFQLLHMPSFLGIVSFMPCSPFPDKSGAWVPCGATLSPGPFSGTVSSKVSAQQLILEACIARQPCRNHKQHPHSSASDYQSIHAGTITSIFEFFGLPQYGTGESFADTGFLNRSFAAARVKFSLR